LFDVVFRVEDYPLFVPACVKSKIIEQNHSYVRADLEIGIPPLIWEKYTSRVTFDRPNIINAKCIDGKLFKHLETQWKFTDGLPHLKNSCTLDFSLSFEFRSYLHSHLVHVFFDEMARQTVNAFLKRAEILYGKQNFYLSNELPNKT
jgi:coenzyme Q-binding protein COQ10